MDKYDNGDSLYRVLNVFILMDTSNGNDEIRTTALDKIDEIFSELESIESRNLDLSIKVSVLFYSSEVSWMFPEPICLHELTWVAPTFGTSSNLGQALSFLESEINLHKTKWIGGLDVKPLFILLSNSTPSDNWEEGFSRIMRNEWFSYGIKVAKLGNQDNDNNFLSKLTSSFDAVFDSSLNSCIDAIRFFFNLEKYYSTNGQDLDSFVINDELEKSDEEHDASGNYDCFDDTAVYQVLNNSYFILEEDDHSDKVESDGQKTEPRYAPPSSSCLTSEKGWMNIFEWTSSVFKRYYNDVYTSVFSPAEVCLGEHMLIQVFLHRFEETDFVKDLAKESDPNAERRYYSPLHSIMKKGDEIGMQVSIMSSSSVVFTDSHKMIWQGKLSRFCFDFFIPDTLPSSQLFCTIMIFVNSVPVGTMQFVINVMEHPKGYVYANVESKKYEQVFISYAKEDYVLAKSFASVYEQQKIQYFLDKVKLKGGDVFWEVIKNNIDNSDLFVLLWSENSAKSLSVTKERKYAMTLAYPQVTPASKASLHIIPYSIEPRADFPSDMKDIYQFEQI